MKNYNSRIAFLISRLTQIGPYLAECDYGRVEELCYLINYEIQIHSKASKEEQKNS